MSQKKIIGHRKDYEPPAVISESGWRFHHMGIPTETPRQGEQYLEHLKMYVSGFETNPYGIEWMRFEQGSPVSELASPAENSTITGLFTREEKPSWAAKHCVIVGGPS